MERVRGCRLGRRGKDDGFCFEPRKYALGIDCNQDLIGKRQVLVIRRKGRWNCPSFSYPRPNTPISWQLPLRWLPLSLDLSLIQVIPRTITHTRHAFSSFISACVWARGRRKQKVICSLALAGEDGPGDQLLFLLLLPCFQPGSVYCYCPALLTDAPSISSLQVWKETWQKSPRARAPNQSWNHPEIQQDIC